MKIEKNKLVNRAQVLNKDIQLGIVAYSVAEMASILEQAEKKLPHDMRDAEYKAIKATISDAIEYIKSAKELCNESGLDWNVCVLLSHTNLDKYVEGKND